MIEPVPQPQSTQKQRHVAEIDQYLSDLTQAEIALMRLIYGLQQRRGRCYASMEYLAEQLDISARQVRNLLWGRPSRRRGGGHQPGLWERGLILRTRQQGKRHLLHLSGRGLQAVENPSVRRNRGSAHPGTAVPPRGGTAVPPMNYKGEKEGPGGSGVDLPSGPPGLFSELFNVFALPNPHGLTPGQLWVNAFHDGRFTFALWGGQRRTILSVREGHGQCLMELATNDPENPQPVRFNSSRLTELKFWRDVAP